MNPSGVRSTGGLAELALVFLKLGATAFGGPAAHVAIMEHEFVRTRRWLTRAEFLDLLGATNLIPGPNSTEMAIHIGHRRAGWAGWAVAGLCFIMPAALMVAVLAWVYVRLGRLPEFGALLYGVKPVMIAVVAQALWSLGRTALKAWSGGVVVVIAVALNLAGVHELVVLFGAGAAYGLARALGDGRRTLNGGVSLLGWLQPPAISLAVASGGVVVAPFNLWVLFGFFLKVGSVLFGSGYVLLAFLRADLVERWHWLSESQLLDAIAVGQITPGPLFTTATFIGYLLNGFSGATVATVGIFLPAFVFVALSGPLIPRVRASPVAGAFLDGVNLASLALMAVVAARLGVGALVDVPAAVAAGVAGWLLMYYRVNSAWLVLGGGLFGLLRLLASRLLQ